MSTLRNTARTTTYAIRSPATVDPSSTGLLSLLFVSTSGFGKCPPRWRKWAHGSSWSKPVSVLVLAFSQAGASVGLTRSMLSLIYVSPPLPRLISLSVSASWIPLYSATRLCLRTSGHPLTAWSFIPPTDNLFHSDAQVQLLRSVLLVLLLVISNYASPKR